MHITVPNFIISTQDACLYRDEGFQLVAFVNDRMATHSHVSKWLGPNSFSMLEDNHRKHHAFMSTVFVFSSAYFLVFSRAFSVVSHSVGIRFRCGDGIATTGMRAFTAYNGIIS